MGADLGHREVVFGYPPIVRFAPIVILLIMVGGFALTFTKQAGTVFVVAAVIALAMALVLRRRVELGPDAVVLIELLSSRRFQRDEIAAVSWEPGTRVALELKTGGHVSLPSLSGDHADMSNSIHNWLREGQTS
jgi:uncharacterized membrane protein